ncbi:hypothetical protein BDL97_14G087000 [Sphagnum fallax]|nr:hypothetical protein BDL97_14G087000 [Sphagnum fallax]
MAAVAAWREVLHMMSDDVVLGIVLPLVVYWLYAGMYHMMMMMMPPALEPFRLHSVQEEEQRNLFTGMVGEHKKQPSLAVQAAQVLVAMVVMDTWQYFIHRLMHVNKFLYKHIHSQHHRLVVPYAFGALYNHPAEGFLLDTIGGAVSFLVSGMTPRTATFFFSLATMKTVDDHCGLWLPGNPFQRIFSNNTAYHDIHHQLHGNKAFFSKSFFTG